MIIIYNCYGGSHSSVTASAIHLGLLPEDRVASDSELLNIPYYDAQVAKDHGRIRLMGSDQRGNQVFIASKRNLGKHYERIMREVLKIMGVEGKNVLFVDTMPYVNLWMVIGGYLSRRLGYKRLGRRIILFGTRQSYFKFVHLVQLVKKRDQAEL